MLGDSRRGQREPMTPRLKTPGLLLDSIKRDTFGVQVNFLQNIAVFLNLVKIILLLRENGQSAITSTLELPATCRPHQDERIPLSALPNGTTSKLAGLFSTLSL